jgi:hypothetical protein
MLRAPTLTGVGHQHPLRYPVADFLISDVTAITGDTRIRSEQTNDTFGRNAPEVIRYTSTKRFRIFLAIDVQRGFALFSETTFIIYVPTTMLPLVICTGMALDPRPHFSPHPIFPASLTLTRIMGLIRRGVFSYRI